MSNLIKLLVQTGVAAGTAFGKAFKQAVQNELKNGRASTSQTGGSENKQQTKTKTKSNYAHGMTLAEAVQILDVKPELSPEDIDKRFKHLFETNEKTKGGSFYLQSKVYRARERIASELERQGINLDEVVGPVPTNESKADEADDAESSKSDGEKEKSPGDLKKEPPVA